jgi:hypothetical protein
MRAFRSAELQSERAKCNSALSYQLAAIRRPANSDHQLGCASAATSELLSADGADSAESGEIDANAEGSVIALPAAEGTCTAVSGDDASG